MSRLIAATEHPVREHMQGGHNGNQRLHAEYRAIRILRALTALFSESAQVSLSQGATLKPTQLLAGNALAECGASSLKVRHSLAENAVRSRITSAVTSTALLIILTTHLGTSATSPSLMK
jgi:hypothetical protein